MYKIHLNTLLLIIVCFPFSLAAQINHYSINQSLIGVGQKTFDINNDGNDDYLFEIISLSPGTLAARVNTLGTSEILDNSTFGYPDALNFNDVVTGYFHTGVGVLGTFTNAGQFNGMGNKYLGIKMKVGGSNFLGWIEINCSVARDTLSFIATSYNTVSDASIYAGQTIASGINTTSFAYQNIHLFPNPCSTTLQINGIWEEFEYCIYSVMGESLIRATSSKIIDVSGLRNGMYILEVKQKKHTFHSSFSVYH